VALVIGIGIGTLVARFPILRAAVGSLITGLQTMPSIAWFPLAIVLFKLSEEAITFVVVLGAAPSIANGLIHGIDHIPPPLLQQLKPDGLMVIPVGPPGAQRILKVVKETATSGQVAVRRSDIYNGRPVPFVPFTKLDGDSIKGTH